MFYCVVTLFAGIKYKVVMATMGLLIHLGVVRYVIVFLIYLFLFR